MPCAHEAFSAKLVIGCDIALTPDGSLLLEGNAYPDVDFLQRVHRCPLGLSPLGELLYARIAELERRFATDSVPDSHGLDSDGRPIRPLSRSVIR